MATVCLCNNEHRRKLCAFFLTLCHMLVSRVEKLFHKIHNLKRLEAHKLDDDQLRWYLSDVINAFLTILRVSQPVKLFKFILSNWGAQDLREKERCEGAQVGSRLNDNKMGFILFYEMEDCIT